MHTIEPFYNWRDKYVASEDEKSPLHGAQYNEFSYTNKIYNYFIHPQWDEMGSKTLYIKVLFADYEKGYAVVEMIGEWNDCIDNDIMILKRNIVDPMIKNGISKFILVGENVLNFHGSDDCYYEEWWDDVKDNDGWMVMVNFRDHVLNEMRDTNVHHYLNMGDAYKDLKWRTFQPDHFFQTVEQLLFKVLS